jgi:hypothetical protein
MNQESMSTCREYCWSIIIIVDEEEHSPDTIGHGTNCTMPMRNKEDDDDDGGDWKIKAMVMRRQLLLTMLQWRLVMMI